MLPDTLSTYDAFVDFPGESRRRHFIRRTKEELVRFDEKPLYPQRKCDTLSYDLAQGPGSEQELYDETTDYIANFYNQAQLLNRSAARLAMSVFQRRLASSTYALMRSFERRKEKLEGLIDDIRSGRLNERQMATRQRRLEGLEDIFETRTFDESAAGEDGGADQEAFEEKALGATAAISLSELEEELGKVEALLDKARTLYEAGEESKFEKLQGVLRDPEFAGEKLIIFTEHRDTADFLIRRLEGLGFTGRIALIHGGMPYQERERQVDFFRKPAAGRRRRLSRRHRRRRRRHQSPVLLADGQLRHSLEPRPPGTAHGPHSSIRAAARSGRHRQPGGRRDPGGQGDEDAAGEAGDDPAPAGGRTRSST